MKLDREQPMNWRLLDGSKSPLDGKALLPFAVDELECRLVGKGAQPFVHIWRHEKAFILGLRDRKLEMAADGMESLNHQGYAVAVRNSGGAAVPLDEGVLNISLILPNPTGITNLHEDFAIMADLIRETIHELTGTIEVSVGEVVGAYCPGAFDLAIGGRKFCGIAQRRQTGAYIVQAFIVIEGVGAERARLVADFYRDAAGDNDKGFPTILEQATASVQESIDATSVLASDLAAVSNSISIVHFVQKFKEILLRGNAPLQLSNHYDHYDQEELNQLITQMESRYSTD
ncbi:MAG: biotin/lipoate A/B protein ligase family protein [Paenibacillaceae bacterium]